jgi:hypothetical protein
VRDAVDRGEATLIGRTIAAECADVVEGPRLTAYHPIAADHVGIGGGFGLGFEDRFIEPPRERIDQIDVARELIVLFARDLPGDENSQMTDALMDRIDDRLAARADFIATLVEIKNPAERLLRRRSN